MLFSVIIPTCDRTDLLQLCLEKLVSNMQNVNPFIYEVIVTDDGRDTLAEQLIKDKFLWVRYIKGPQKGPAANRNNGAKYAKGEWYVFLDDDIIPSSGLLTVYANAISEFPNCFAFEGAILSTDLIKGDRYECPVNTKGGYFWSANVCIYRDIFWKIGGFDENYLYAALEDQDIFYRLTNITQIPFIMEAQVRHPLREINLLKKIKHQLRMTNIWVYHARKHKRRLGFEFDSSIFYSHLRFYSKDFVRSMIKLRFRNAVLRFASLTLGSFALANALLRKDHLK